MALVPFPNKSAKAIAEADPDPDWDGDEEESGAGRMSFLEHLDELRRRIVYSLLALVVGVIVACFFLPQLRSFVMTPMFEALGTTKLVYTEPTEGMMLWIKIA